MKILALDVETAPHTAYVWRLFDDHVPIGQLIETGRVMCFSAKWTTTKGAPIFFSENREGREEMVEAAHAWLDEADAVLTFNGKKFDIPMLNAEFMKLGMAPPSPYHHIDLYQVVRSKFKFASNKLAHILTLLGLSPKEDHRGFQLWVDCMNGDKKSWKEMEKYNKQDVASLIELYDYVLPWITNHPNVGLYTDINDPVCTNCGSDDLQARGYQHNRTHSYRRYQCNDCGTWVRARLGEKNGKGHNIMVQAR